MRIVICIAALALGACASSPGRDTYSLPPEAVATPVPVANGSIYASTQNIALFEDRKARQVGDVLTVLLVEKTDAKKSAATNTSKDGSFSMPGPTMFGRHRAAAPRSSTSCAARSASSARRS